MLELEEIFKSIDEEIEKIKKALNEGKIKC